MWRAINHEGFHIDRDKTARFMKLAGVSSRHLGRYQVTTISPQAPDQRPGLVQRHFRTHAPGSCELPRLLSSHLVGLCLHRICH